MKDGVCLINGGDVTDEHKKLKENGQQEDYLVICHEDRSKGFVRPYRDSYVHKKCGVSTKMHSSIAETYARDPKFYTGTFCVGCGKHFPVSEFIWEGTTEEVGS